MPFSQATITSVSVTRDDVDLLISWLATGPGPFQVYVDRILAWHGTETSCLIPWPAESNTPIDVGTVDPGEEEIDFSADLPPAPATHATLTWQGGTFEDEDISSFNIYSSAVPGGAVSYTKPISTITAYPLDIFTDGYNLGGYNQGGFGYSASNYTWRSNVLSSGTWQFAVKPVDVAGNEGPARLASVVIAAPPRPPAADSFGIRLRYVYDPISHVATMNWSASPP